ncbi:hypothetical protein HDV05_006041 [Chytridiales sp. JEL 0842]|nr:hypothetical protein HDV05_006041 [Chytridiales sp. JEL 0842]
MSMLDVEGGPGGVVVNNDDEDADGAANDVEGIRMTSYPLSQTHWNGEEWKMQIEDVHGDKDDDSAGLNLLVPPPPGPPSVPIALLVAASSRPPTPNSLQHQLSPEQPQHQKQNEHHASPQEDHLSISMLPLATTIPSTISLSSSLPSPLVPPKPSLPILKVSPPAVVISPSSPPQRKVHPRTIFHAPTFNLPHTLEACPLSTASVIVMDASTNLILKASTEAEKLLLGSRRVANAQMGGYRRGGFGFGMTTAAGSGTGLLVGRRLDEYVAFVESVDDNSGIPESDAHHLHNPPSIIRFAELPTLDSRKRRWAYACSHRLETDTGLYNVWFLEDVTDVSDFRELTQQHFHTLQQQDSKRKRRRRRSKLHGQRHEAEENASSEYEDEDEECAKQAPSRGWNQLFSPLAWLPGVGMLGGRGVSHKVSTAGGKPRRERSFTAPIPTASSSSSSESPSRDTAETRPSQPSANSPTRAGISDQILLAAEERIVSIAGMVGLRTIPVWVFSKLRSMAVMPPTPSPLASNTLPEPTTANSEGAPDSAKDMRPTSEALANISTERLPKPTSPQLSSAPLKISSNPIFRHPSLQSPTALPNAYSFPPTLTLRLNQFGRIQQVYPMTVFLGRSTEHCMNRFIMRFIFEEDIRVMCRGMSEAMKMGMAEFCVRWDWKSRMEESGSEGEEERGSEKDVLKEEEEEDVGELDVPPLEHVRRRMSSSEPSFPIHMEGLCDPLPVPQIPTIFSNTGPATPPPPAVVQHVESVESSATLVTPLDHAPPHQDQQETLQEPFVKPKVLVAWVKISVTLSQSPSTAPSTSSSLSASPYPSFTHLQNLSTNPPPPASRSSYLQTPQGILSLKNPVGAPSLLCTVTPLPLKDYKVDEEGRVGCWNWVSDSTVGGGRVLGLDEVVLDASGWEESEKGESTRRENEMRRGMSMPVLGTGLGFGAGQQRSSDDEESQEEAGSEQTSRRKWPGRSLSYSDVYQSSAHSTSASDHGSHQHDRQRQHSSHQNHAKSSRLRTRSSVMDLVVWPSSTIFDLFVKFRNNIVAISGLVMQLGAAGLVAQRGKLATGKMRKGRSEARYGGATDEGSDERGEGGFGSERARRRQRLPTAESMPVMNETGNSTFLGTDSSYQPLNEEQTSVTMPVGTTPSFIPDDSSDSSAPPPTPTVLSRHHKKMMEENIQREREKRHRSRSRRRRSVSGDGALPSQGVLYYDNVV